MEKVRRELFDFAYFNAYDTAIHFLSTLAAKEPWDFEDEVAEHHTILRNYLEHTFRRVKAEGKICYTADNLYACFDTGLFTQSLEPIYAFFSKNRIPGKSPYFFTAFLKRSDNQMLYHFHDAYPVRANYFEHPEELIFNPNSELIFQVDHIIKENKERFPRNFQNLPNEEIMRRFEGAVEECKKRVWTNYTLAVPQFYEGKIQLLLPLNLTFSSSNPDLALAVSRVSDKTYTARTCLTLKMAYNNARLIIKPQSSWLHP